MNFIQTSQFRIVREADEPLGLFFRPGASDHTVLKQLLSEGHSGMLGAIFDPCHCKFQEEFRTELLQRNLDVVLDTGMMELATIVGHTTARQALSWASSQPHIPTDFSGPACEKIADQIARFAIEKKFTAILAPTHYLEEGAKDPWFPIDKRITLALRQRLDDSGHSNTSIYYPLAIASRTLIDDPARTNLKALLSGMPIDAIWMRVHPFGSHSGDILLRRYIQACQDLHGLGLPLVAEKTGFLGSRIISLWRSGWG